MIFAGKCECDILELENHLFSKNGNYFIHKTINSGGDYLTAIIAEKSNMDLIEAEEYKAKNKFFTNNFQSSATLF